MSATFDYRSRDPERLAELLALPDEKLIAALGGRRRDAMSGEWASFESCGAAREGVQTICRHDVGYPASFVGDGAPRMLHVAGGLDRLSELASAPTVAIVGSRKATDYGMEIAKGLARGLAACGITVTSELADGIAVAALAGAGEVDRGTVAATAGGLDVACPARWRGLYGRVQARGCSVSELPCDSPPRRWTYAAGARIAASLAELTIVVEAEDCPSELMGARLAQSLGRTLAAVPGRVTSPASGGTHRLLREGAALIAGPEDALELLGRSSQPRGRSRHTSEPHGPTTPTTPTAPTRPTARAGRAAPTTRVELEPRLRHVLEAVGAGRDTAAQLAAGDMDGGETLLALSELELMGRLSRGDGGRYVPRQGAAFDLEGERARGDGG